MFQISSIQVSAASTEPTSSGRWHRQRAGLRTPSCKFVFPSWLPPFSGGSHQEEVRGESPRRTLALVAEHSRDLATSTELRSRRHLYEKKFEEEAIAQRMDFAPIRQVNHAEERPHYWEYR